MPENLIDGLLSQMNRVRELIKIYEELPGGAGMIGAKLMKIDIQEAEKSISSGDTIQMLLCYEELKSCQ